MAPNPATVLQVSALQAASPIVVALAQCDEELRVEAIELFRQLSRGDLDEEQRFATTALLAEILFLNPDEKGLHGLDLAEAEARAPSVNPGVEDVLDRMDQDQVVFSERLRELMEAKGMTQAELADKVGIGQPAISMMLNRACRPQRKTVVRFAEALGVRPEELWPPSSLLGGSRLMPRRAIELLDQLGNRLTDEDFRVLHHKQGETKKGFREYCESVETFRPGEANERVRQRLEIVLAAFLAVPPSYQNQPNIGRILAEAATQIIPK